MSAKKVRISGWVDQKLKAEFIKCCHSEAILYEGAPKLSQSKLLEIFLTEGVAIRKTNGRKRRSTAS